MHQGCILSPCLFNLHAEYIMQNARLCESQAGIKIAGRNINNLIYMDDTTLMAECKEELKSVLMRLKEKNNKSWLKTQKKKKKTKTMASSPITSWQIEEENVGAEEADLPDLSRSWASRWYIFIYIGILLSYKKEWNNAICSNIMDLEIIILSEVNQTKASIIWHHLYVETKKWYKLIYLQIKNRLTDI